MSILEDANKDQVIVTLRVEGTHSWPDCPFDEVAYLRLDHRHIFHIKCWKAVSHDDRDVEIIMLKHDIEEFLFNEFGDSEQRLHIFGARSCEMIARKLNEKFDLVQCEVLEDGENGALIAS